MQFRFYASSPSTTATTVKPKIDRGNLTISGITAMQAGVEALGHGVMTDGTTLDLMLQLAQANPKPFRQRFGHPGISENAAGKQVAQASNFRIQNGNLLHDSRLLESARISPAFAQDPIEFILTVAETDPDMFSESVVIDADVVWRLSDGREVPQYPPRDEDGDVIEDADIVRDDRTKRPITATTPLPLLRPTEFYYVDFVSEGALTHDGLFPEDMPETMQRLFASGVSAYAEELFNLVDNWLESYRIPLSDLPKKCDQLLSSYISIRSKDKKFMNRNQNFSAVDEQNDESEVVVAAAQPELDPLAAMETLAASLGTVEFTELRSEPGVIEHLAADIAELSAKYTKMSEKFDRMLQLLQANLEATSAMQRNLTRVSGEPVVTARVPKQAKTTLENVQPQYVHPAPSALQFSSKPGMNSAMREMTPLEQSIALQRERARFANMSQD